MDVILPVPSTLVSNLTDHLTYYQYVAEPVVFLLFLIVHLIYNQDFLYCIVVIQSKFMMTKGIISMSFHSLSVVWIS